MPCIYVQQFMPSNIHTGFPCDEQADHPLLCPCVLCNNLPDYHAHGDALHKFAAFPSSRSIQPHDLRRTRHSCVWDETR
ncbi:hypothetical protein KC327_g55 [Hortaea werneckii]|nr:hypothetical protein KC327_g55 [Hortaea werneckii]